MGSNFKKIQQYSIRNMFGEIVESIQLNKEELQAQKKTFGYIPGQNMGKWSDIEQLRYIAFLDFNKTLMRSRQKRSSNKFYDQMSKFITTRNALQCRSHHQKLEEKYGHYTKIIKRYKKTFNKPLYKQNILNLEMTSTNHLDEQIKKPQTFFRQSKKSQSVEIQTEICGIETKFVIAQSKPVKIEKQSLRQTVIPEQTYFNAGSRMNNMYAQPHVQPQYYQPYMYQYNPSFFYPSPLHFQ